MSFSSAFRKSAGLILRVHYLVRIGKGESAEANLLRADSEAPWYEMTDEEQEIVGGLSEDLHDLRRERIERPSTILGSPEMQQLQREQNWPQLLVFLRRHKDEIDSAKLSAARGCAWAQMMQDDAAVEFLGHAYDAMHTLSEDAAILFLQSAVSLGAFESAEKLALSILNSDTASSAQRLAAVQWRFARLVLESDHPDAAALDQILRQIDLAFSTGEILTTDKPHLRLLIRNARLISTCCHGNLKQWSKARTILNQVLDEFPTDEDAIKLQALLPAGGEDNESYLLSGTERRNQLRKLAMSIVSSHKLMAA